MARGAAWQGVQRGEGVQHGSPLCRVARLLHAHSVHVGVAAQPRREVTLRWGGGEREVLVRAGAASPVIRPRRDASVHVCMCAREVSSCISSRIALAVCLAQCAWRSGRTRGSALPMFHEHTRSLISVGAL